MKTSAAALALGEHAMSGPAAPRPLPSAAGALAQLAPSTVEDGEQLGKRRPKPLRPGLAQKPKITRLAPPWQHGLLKKRTCDSQQSSQPRGLGPTLYDPAPLFSHQTLRKALPHRSPYGPNLIQKWVMEVALARFSLEGPSAGLNTTGNTAPHFARQAFEDNTG